jgi:hypothetical protein
VEDKDERDDDKEVNSPEDDLEESVLKGVRSVVAEIKVLLLC